MRHKLVFYIDYKADGSAVIRSLPVDEALDLASAGFMVQVFDTLDEARRERDLLARMNNRVESN